MVDNDNTPNETAGHSRRSLLAKAAAAGAVVYAVPMVSSIPAYASGALDSFRVESGTVCLWFSPNQVNPNGRWHADIVNATDGIIATANSGSSNPPILDVNVRVDSLNRAVRLTGNPDNNPGTSGIDGDGSGTASYLGGGVHLECLAADCEIHIESVLCRKQTSEPCITTNVNQAPATWALGSSENPINSATAPNEDVGGGNFASAYYHSGRTGHGVSGRCRLSFLFRVRCR